MLARLAETGVLPSVEVLSTVSGGSIVGAHYYLELQRLLESKPDGEIEAEDYVRLVKRLQNDFLAGIQINIRNRMLSSLKCNLKMLVPRWISGQLYTRSRRIGELYEEVLYSKVQDERGNATRKMSDLRITPRVESKAGHSEPANLGFKPAFSNWRRRAKVPVLLLNTTSLNSGHNWHYTASWMGESPGLVGQSIDINPRYRRLYYSDAPTKELQEYRLGHAVAAAACVPALFEPLEIAELYPGRTVRLVDGGVHDNQGVGGLLNESCDFIFCSDASGQMDDEPSPSDGTLGVPLRASTIQGDRLREAEYQDLDARARGRTIHGLFSFTSSTILCLVRLTGLGAKNRAPRNPKVPLRSIMLTVSCSLNSRRCGRIWIPLPTLRRLP